MKIKELFEIKINLGGSSNLSDFLQDFYDHTDPHPFNRNARVFNKRVTIELSKFGDEIHFGDISTLVDQGQGHGTNALKMIKSLADKYKVTISGVAVAYSGNPDHIRKDADLANWYKKNGFKVTKVFDEYEISYTGK